jgi:hypothetical protein
MNEATQYCNSRLLNSYRQYTVEQDKLIYEYDVRNMQLKKDDGIQYHSYKQ